MDPEQVNELIQQYQPEVLAVATKLLAAVLIFYIGKYIAGVVRNAFKRLMTARKVDATLVGFVGNLVYGALLAFTVIAALGQIGIQTASFVAVLGAAGLAIGLALQGSLSNFAAGVMLLIFRPFKAGDFVEVAGVGGIIEEIGIFTTQMRTGDNKTLIIPNGQVTDGVIVNYSTKPTRRVDLMFGIGYEDDIDKAREVINGVIAADARIHDDPEPLVVVSELADSSVNFTVRVWVDSGDYWPVKFALTEETKKSLDAANISIPYPQHDVHIHQQAS